jgi:hypothetical protein
VCGCRCGLVFGCGQTAVPQPNAPPAAFGLLSGRCYKNKTRRQNILPPPPPPQFFFTQFWFVSVVSKYELRHIPRNIYYLSLCVLILSPLFFTHETWTWIAVFWHSSTCWCAVPLTFTVLSFLYCIHFLSRISPLYYLGLSIPFGVRKQSISINNALLISLVGTCHNPFHVWMLLTFWRRNFLLNFSTPVCKTRIIQEPKKAALWNKQHFEEKKRRVCSMFKKFSMYICWKNI